MIVDEIEIIKLPKFTDPRGNLSFVEQEKHIPFVIKRTYWLYDVPGGENRGGHAYRENQEFIVALSGSFDVVLDDGEKKKTSTCTVEKVIFEDEPNIFSNSALLT